MRKIMLSFLLLLALFALAVYLLTFNREAQYPKATFTLLNAAETDWYNAGITHYRLVVEVAFSRERRRHMARVENGQIAEASISYWDGKNWTAPEPSGLDAATNYLIPGLFNILRVELNNNLREDLRVEMNQAPAFPRYIYFGQVWLDNEPMEDSEARITVIEFEQLPP